MLNVTSRIVAPAGSCGEERMAHQASGPVQETTKNQCLNFHLLLTISGVSIPPGMALTARMYGLKVRLEEQSTRLSNRQDRMSPLPTMVQCYVGLMVLPLYQLQAINVII